MSCLWKIDLKDSKEVFLKTYKFDGCSGKHSKDKVWKTQVEYITKEIRIARDGIQNNKFNHPNVVQFYDAQFRGTAKRPDGTLIKDAVFPFIVTELVNGLELDQYLKKYAAFF